MRFSSFVISLLFGTVAAFGITCTAQATPLVYNFQFFNAAGSNIGSGFLSVEQSVLDSALDVSSVNPADQAPAGSKFVRMTDLHDLSFSVLGNSYTLADHLPVAFVTVEGVIFNSDLSFRQFIDANIPGSPPDSSASGIAFGSIGSRIIFSDVVPAGFQVEGSDACPSRLPFTDACSFSVTRAVIPEPATLAVLMTGILGLGAVRRHRTWA